MEDDQTKQSETLERIVGEVCKGAVQRIDASVLILSRPYKATVYRVGSQELVRCDLKPLEESQQ